MYIATDEATDKRVNLHKMVGAILARELICLSGWSLYIATVKITDKRSSLFKWVEPLYLYIQLQLKLLTQDLFTYLGGASLLLKLLGIENIH